jgi:hypothetical protein
MALRCDGCNERAGRTVCDSCGALLCARCFGPFTGGTCEACIAEAANPPLEPAPFIEDVPVNPVGPVIPTLHAQPPGAVEGPTPPDSILCSPTMPPDGPGGLSIERRGLL